MVDINAGDIKDIIKNPAAGIAKKILGGKTDWLNRIIIALAAITLLVSLILPLGFGIVMALVIKQVTTGGFGDNVLAQNQANITLSGTVSGQLTYPTNVAPAQIAGCLDSWIKKNAPNSPLNGKGITFATAGQQHNVNPAFLLAMGGSESTFATNWGSITADSFNYASLTCGCTQKSPCFKKPGSTNPRTWEKYQSWDDAITRHAQYIRTRYLNQSIHTIPGIGAIYCGADCTSWNKDTIDHFNKITAACPSLTVPN